MIRSFDNTCTDGVSIFVPEDNEPVVWTILSQCMPDLNMAQVGIGRRAASKDLERCRHLREIDRINVD